MERPSHKIAIMQFHTGPRRVTGMGLSFLMPPLLGLGLMWGFVVETVTPRPPTDYIDVQKPVEAKTPPPPAPDTFKPVDPTVTAPTFEIDSPSTGTPITIVPQTKEPPVSQPPPQAKVNTVPDRAAISIAATHTSPPYPTIARRLGAEGRVMLRLTILADGKVSKADVVTSSGRRDFDEAAQSWIVQHWTYQPAIKDGVPAASQAMAAVNFTLTNP